MTIFELVKGQMGMVSFVTICGKVAETVQQIFYLVRTAVIQSYPAKLLAGQRFGHWLGLDAAHPQVPPDCTS